MNIFIGGSKTVNIIDDAVKEKLTSISKNSYDIIIGDCCGIDTAVQGYLKAIDYSKVT